MEVAPVERTNATSGEWRLMNEIRDDSFCVDRSRPDAHISSGFPPRKPTFVMFEEDGFVRQAIKQKVLELPSELRTSLSQPSQRRAVHVSSIKVRSLSIVAVAY